MKTTTHDAQMDPYREAYVEYDTSPNHWSTSPEWRAYVAARERAAQKQFVDPLQPRDLVTETQEMRDTLARFNETYPPVSEPTHVVDDRSAELRAAEVDLQRAVQRMRKFAHPDRVVDLVKRYVSE